MDGNDSQPNADGGEARAGQRPFEQWTEQVSGSPEVPRIRPWSRHENS